MAHAHPIPPLPAGSEEGKYPGLRALVRRDALHFMNGSFYQAPLAMTPVRVLRMLLSPEFQVVLRYRVYHHLYRRWLQAPATLLYTRARGIHHCDIHFQTEIGPGLRVAHCSDIVIGPEARLGTDVVVFNGVTLGKRHRRDGTDGMPQVGDRVLLGTGAKLLGPITIGEGARIGANAVVLCDVPTGASAAGIPARVIPARPESDGGHLETSVDP